MTDIAAWIIAQGLNGSSVGTLLDGVAGRLTAEGLPLLRAYLALPTVNPRARVVNHTWMRGGALTVESIGHQREPAAFARSPFGYLLSQGRTSARWRLDESADPNFEIFDELRRQGASDYVARIVAFDNEHAPALRGVAASFSADRPGGFTDAEIARIDEFMPLLALAAYRITLFDLTVGVLDTYIGFSAGRRVLNGEIRRGEGQTLTAALVFADLRSFTPLADRAGADLIARLDEHLEAMAEPVSARGGEVLKFLGDGLLAAFPIDAGRSKGEACAAALDAALDALARNAAVNQAYPRISHLDLDIALHCGDVFYGNIGTSKRLDFTVIGPTVNELSRMEALCSPLGRSLVMSTAVAASCGRPTVSLGRHTLRGIPDSRELFTVA